MAAVHPLSGLTVVEIGTSVAAPVAGHILADLGALVVKVEAPGSGDDARGWGPPFDQGVAPVFRTLNRNKRSVEVNLKDADARAALRRYILAEADGHGRSHHGAAFRREADGRPAAGGDGQPRGAGNLHGNRGR
jgi:crotonobetainyl-CoA:carnitine CoA-transferase CaiB-like acyl-CoA transferase